MKCTYTKLFCTLLAALFLLLSALSSHAGELCSEGWDHEAREAEDQQLTIILTQLQTTQQEQEQLLKEQEILINSSKQEIAQLNSSLNKALQSLKEERRETLAKIIGAGCAGFFLAMVLDWIIDAIKAIKDATP